MIVETAASGRLVWSMIVSMIAACALFWLGVWQGGLSGWMLVAMAIYAGLNAWTAWRLDDARGALMTLTPGSLVLHPALVPNRAILWEEVKRIHTYRLRLWRIVPVMNWTTISLRDRSLLPAHARWLPTGWFKALIVPTRFAAGGHAMMERAAALARAYQEGDRQERLGSVGARRAAALPPEPSSARSPEALPGDFDPDAALARYLARKGEASAPQPMLNGRPLTAEPRRGFGRKAG